MLKPRFDWPIIGHKNIIQYLQSSIVFGKITHAYLFFGPPNTGKTAVAENFVNSLICENLTKNTETVPCRQCLACKQMEKKIHPDIVWLKREIDEKTKKIKKNIAVDQIRELQNRLSVRSFLNSYKAAIILEAENLNAEAANSLLKTLEEPTAKTVLILLTSRLDYLPKTILSRCQILKFLPVPRNEILNYFLNNLKVARKEAKIFSNLALGRPGLAIKFFSDKELFWNYQEQIKQFLDLNGQDVNQKFETVNSMFDLTNDDFLASINSIQKTLDIWLELLRDLILIKNYQKDLITNYFLSEKLEKSESQYSLKNIIKSAKKIGEAKKFLAANVNPRLVLENLVLEF